MATNTSTIKSSGGDYTSRSAWWTAKGGANLVTATTIEEAECYDFEDTTAFSMTASTTSALYYYRIFTAAGNKHDGSFGTGARMKASVNYGGVMNFNVAYTRIEDQSIENTSPTEPSVSACTYKAGVVVTGNMFKATDDASGSGGSGLILTGCTTLTLKDNLILGACSTGRVCDVFGISGTMYNNTAINTGSFTGDTYRLAGSPSADIKNNIAQGAGTNYNVIGASGTNSNNLSEDTTAPGTSAVTSTALTFDADYNLVAGDAAAHTAGIGPASDSEVRTVDNIDVARSGTTCSIGCREYVTAGGGATIPVITNHLRFNTGSGL